MSSAQGELFINRPPAKAYHHPFTPNPEGTNPVVKGLPLALAATAISNLSFVQQFLWNNAGFSRLRDRPELEDVEPRYEPLVILVKCSGTAATSAEESQYLKSLLADDGLEMRRSRSPVHRNVLDFHDAYKSGRLTPIDVAKYLIPLISRDRKDPSKHSTAFIQVREDLVLRAAEESTRRYESGNFLSVLDGVPVAIKDEVDLTGYRKTFGSVIDFTRKDDATSYFAQKWLDAGAMIVGKTNMHEMGSDTTNNNVTYGTPLNPNNDNYYCGGSSGGSAYAVAAGLTPLCEGNDGGGSIRIPANYVGVYGLKPSHGRVSDRPSVNLAKSNGVAGPLAANMIDLEIGYRIMAQPDALDPTSALFIPPGSIPTQSTKPKLLGIFRSWFGRADPVVANSCQKAIDYLVRERGYETVDIEIPLLAEGQSAHGMTILSELVTGINPADTHKLSPANKVLLSVARKTTSVDLLEAQRVRNLLMQHLSHLFTQHPGLIITTPTTPNAGWRIEEGELTYGVTNGNKQIRNMEYVWLANFTGCPAITSPIAFTDPDPAVKGTGQIPIGLQGTGEWCSEDQLISFGYDCEAYLTSALAGGRIRPKNWTDILELAAKAKEST